MFAATQVARRRSTLSAGLPSTSSSYGCSNIYNSNASNGNGYGCVPVVEDIARSSVCSASTGASDDTYYRDKLRKESNSNALSHLLLAAMGMLLLMWTMHSRAQRAWVLRELQVQSFQEAVNAFHELKDEHQEAFDELEYHYSRNERLEQRDEAWGHQMELLQNATQRESWRAVMDKYGPGPHKVQFTVELPDDKSQDTFLVEMAPIKWMPHAVHLFLEQVSHGLWNNSVFQVNRDHVVQVGPATKEHRHHFREYELDRLAFPEYTDYFPHKKWTMGFAGRPGGPSWYINKLDNVEDHGPYGQDHHALDEFADACFAKIVDGFDVLEKVFEQKMGERTKIASAVILGWEDHWTDDDEEEWQAAHDEYGDYYDIEDDYWFAEDGNDGGRNQRRAGKKDSNSVSDNEQVEILPNGDYIVKSAKTTGNDNLLSRLSQGQKQHPKPGFIHPDQEKNKKDNSDNKDDGQKKKKKEKKQ